MNEPCILHLDADAFFASVEQAADPRLRGRPVAVGGAKRGVVASASYEARRLGIYSTMPTARARKLCPSLVVVAGDFEKYERFSRFVFSYAYDFTPAVEVASIDEGYADLSGQRKTSPRQVAETIRKAVRQSLRITLSEGIGTNKLVSAVASKLKKPDALIEIPPGGERAFLAPLEARWLPGIGPQLAERFRRAGLVRIAQIAETPPAQLSLFAGSQAGTLWEMAHGIDARPVVPDAPAPQSLSEQETFDRDTADEHLLRARLRQMADRLLAKLRGMKRTARTLEVRIRYNDFDDARRSESFREPTDLECDVYPAIDRLLRRAWERRVTLRLVGLKFSHLYGAIFQDTLDWGWDGGAVPRGRRYEAALAVDRLREEFGPSAILRGHDLFLKEGAKNATKLQRKVDVSPASSTSGQECPRSCGSALFGHAPLKDGNPRKPVVPARVAAPTRRLALNMKSSYSFLDSLLSPEAAVRLAVGQGCEAVALADPNLHGAVEFFQAAKEAGIRPILAAEICGSLVYVKNPQGYENLCAALTRTNHTLASQGVAPSDAPEICGRSSDAPLDPGGLIVVPADTFPAVRYADTGERPMFNILQSIRTLTLLDERVSDKRRDPSHFRMAPLAAGIAENILDECMFSFDLGGLNFPRYFPEDGSSAHEFLARLAHEGLLARYGDRRHEAQLVEELGIIAGVGYEEYFLLVWDILQDCRAEGIDWITRGSAADSLVCYCLGISDVCPIRYGLYFKRFLNPDRMALNKLPDIDLDFAHDKKDRVVDLIFGKFGDHAAVVGGFSTYQGRSAFADIAKVLGVSEYQIRRHTEHLPHTSARNILEAASKSDLDFGEDPYATALRLAARLDGFPRHPKMHPCGMVLSRKPVARMCPLFVSASGRPTTQFDMESVEAIGLVKMDILAQGGLAVMRDALSEIQAKTPGASIPPGFSDPHVWKMIASGGARGVHHIESPAMTSLSQMVNVHTIDDLIAIVSVIRPGAANTMRKAQFARRAQGLEPIEYPHPSLEPVLRSTYGVVAYEEHILQICEAFADMPAGRADILRRALVKKKAPESFFPEFAQHARNHGRDEDSITRVWALIMGFRGYAFCRAHSTAYGVEAYQAAWLKCHHPAEFLAAVLTHGKGFHDRLTYSIECRRLGIGFLTPDVNLSRNEYVVTGPIRPPLWQVKGLTDKLLARIATGRPFASLRDFYLRTRPSVSEIDALLRVGAFDSFGLSRIAQYWEFRRLTSGASALPLFPSGEDGFTPDVPDTSKIVRLRDEMELLGFTVSGHPLEMFPHIAWDTYCPIVALPQHPRQRVTLAGMIVADRHHRQSDGRPMKFLSLCDPTGIIECEVFARPYARFGSEILRHPVIEVNATVEPFENANGCTLRVHGIRKARSR